MFQWFFDLKWRAEKAKLKSDRYSSSDRVWDDQYGWVHPSFHDPDVPYNRFWDDGPVSGYWTDPEDYIERTSREAREYEDALDNGLPATPPADMPDEVIEEIQEAVRMKRSA